MDFDKPKVYGDTSITDGLVYITLLILPASLYMAGEACGKQLKGTVWGAGYRWSLSQDNYLR